ncbi:unnamed protein product [Lota lota]
MTLALCCSSFTYTPSTAAYLTFDPLNEEQVASCSEFQTETRLLHLALGFFGLELAREGETNAAGGGGCGDLSLRSKFKGQHRGMGGGGPVRPSSRFTQISPSYRVAFNTCLSDVHAKNPTAACNAHLAEAPLTLFESQPDSSSPQPSSSRRARGSGGGEEEAGPTQRKRKERAPGLQDAG